MNPFNITFGVKSDNYIQRMQNYNEIVNYFDENSLQGKSYIISGIRGSGKTAMLTDIQEYYRKQKDWIVIELLTYSDMLEQLASKIIDASKQIKYLVDFSSTISFAGVSFSISGTEKVFSITTLLEKLLKGLEKNNIKLLICIDDISKNDYTKTFTQEFQYLLRNNYRICLLMTGLYNNIYNLQNDKSLTFLLRTPKITIEPLLLANVSERYKQLFKIEKEKADKLAIVTNGYAFCFQLLGRILWEKNKTVIDSDILNDLDQTLYEYAYERIFDELSEVDKKIIFVFRENRVYETKEIIEKTNINIKLYSLYRDRLIKRGLLISKGYGKVSFVLPRFIEAIEKYSFEY